MGAHHEAFDEMEVIELVIVVVVCVGSFALRSFALLDRRVQRGRVKFVKRS